MSCEIECKLRLPEQEIDQTAHRIDTVLENPERLQVVKDDMYYTWDGTQALFRIRSDGNHVAVTRKAKEVRSDSLEVNEEIEFSLDVSQLTKVEDFFRSLGYSRFVAKRKRGWAWYQGNLTVELMEVASLGWFLEMEVLLPDSADAESVDSALARLSELRRKLELADRPLEGRYYIDMLRESAR